MSAAYNYILSLANANVNLYKIGGPILISVGTVSCIINLKVFSKKTLRKNPCSIYLIACNVTNFLLIYTSILIATLGTGYSIDPSAHNWITTHSLIIKALLIPILMVVLGLWTVKNVRSMNHVTAVVNASTSVGVTIPGGVRTAHSKDRQLIKILLVDTSIYIFFNTMISIILIYQQIMQNQSQSYAQLYLQGFLTSVSVFSAFIPFCIGCYTNLWVSKTFRQEVKNTLTCK
ncbi:unnamed protein product [Adineta steineri]|uniref:Vomeronasal type-1 receptor n=1 Tax=Adineta steineri TaxID=433720 RepID=A0A814T8K7_9BILA|nr:unnamed protein product [Adineta steineri]CAF1350261.1 unnamed protein product [Adineta steineri]CAF1414591.1 unnamed protein product [Adineta steineri]CAF1618730.1 unnamed protein product [Adineta steineri]